MPSWLGLGFLTDTILRPIAITPEIEASLGPVEEFNWPCTYVEHPETFQRGAYDEGTLIAVTEYCVACRSTVRTRKVIGEIGEAKLSPLLQRRA